MTRLTDNLRTSCPHFPASLKLLLFYSVVFKQVLASPSAVTGAKENVTLKRDHFEEGESKARGSLQPSRSRDASAPDNDPIVVTCDDASIWTHSRLQAWTQTINNLQKSGGLSITRGPLSSANAAEAELCQLLVQTIHSHMTDSRPKL